jgi:hypothetical protein
MNILDTSQDNATAIEDAITTKTSLVTLTDTGIIILPVPWLAKINVCPPPYNP